jgi:hypothetical protein
MRCPYLEYIGSGKGIFADTSDDYLCKLSGETMDLYSKKVEYTCDRDAHEDCPLYKNR